MAMNFGTILRHKRTCSLTRESGIALVMALICLAVISTLAVGVMFSTQSEIWTSSNYRATTQARYLAEAGAQQAINYIQTTYAPPSPITLLNLNTVPVTTSAGALPLILATGGMTAPYVGNYSSIDAAQNTLFQNYFATATTQTAFASLSNGAHFDVAMQLISAYQGTDGKWLMRWKIVSEGAVNKIGTTLTNSGNARVQVVEVVDNVVTYSSTGGSSASPSYAAGVFATGKGCGAVSMSGGQYTNSYNSTTQKGATSPTFANTGGDVATYGNVSVTNGAYIYGSVFTPFYNVGTTGSYGISGGPSGGKNPPACSTATGGTEYAVNEDNSGSQVGCTITGGTRSCSQKTYSLPSPAPSYPTPILPTVAKNTAACTGYFGLCAGGSGNGQGTGSSGCGAAIPPSTNPDGSTGAGAANFGAVNFGSCAVITLSAGTYNMDSLLISNGAQVILPATGAVVINILDQGSTISCNGSSTALCANGGTVANDGESPANLTFVYAGTKPVYIDAGTNIFASIYAPNAPATIDGNAGIYGAIVSNTAKFQGSGHVIYDTSLTGQKWNVNTGSSMSTVTGTLHVDEFSWSAF